VISDSMQGNKPNIEVVPVAVVEKDILHHIAQSIMLHFGVSVTVKPSIPMPEAALRPHRNQYEASVVLNAIGEQQSHGALKSLGVTGADLFGKGLNFVFGQARLGGCCGVISLARLRLGTGGPAGRELFLRRIEKEAVHELGHTFGLRHCPDPRCVMYYSNNIGDTDRKSASFCTQCGVPQVPVS